MFEYLVVAAVTYLIGSVSFGAIVAKHHGVDIFSVGSKNSGATNVKRSVGSGAGNLVFILDFLKGMLPCWAIVNFVQKENDLNLKLAICALVSIVMGHSFSIFYRFRGGKGVASTMGGLLAIVPRTFVVGVMVWLVICHATRIVSFASLCFASSLMLTSYLFGYPRECVILTIVLNIVIFILHKDNISRLIKGTEYKFTQKH